MFDYTSTSRIRRKVRSKFTDIRNRVEEELTATYNEYSVAEGTNFKQKIKWMMHRKSSSDDSSSSSSDDESGEKKTLKQRLVLSLFNYWEMYVDKRICVVIN